jgi:hypothetical protein
MINEIVSTAQQKILAARSRQGLPPLAHAQRAPSRIDDAQDRGRLRAHCRFGSP